MIEKPDGPYRVTIENVRPQVDGGRYPVKRVPGETVHVTADIFADGHDVIAAALDVRDVDPLTGTPGAWTPSALQPEPNDRWRGSFVVSRVGTSQFRVQAWIDHFGTWQRDLAKKTAAALDVSSELVEGALMVGATAARLRSPAGNSRKRPARKTTAAHAELSTPSAASAEIDWLEKQARLIGDPSLPMADRVTTAAGERLAETMRRLTPHDAVVALEPPLDVLVEPLRARFGAWYEMFPRSYSPEPGRSATFAEAALRLAAIAEMGFDVVYLPPIHPIGLTNRKGPNNTLTAGADDPGSPWAIGSEDGGHMSVHPALGTLDDFDRFVATARELRLDVALDLAYQCSPDHPYVKTHPEWFRHRPDGSIKYAENPPKRYQDIYPFDFECAAWPALWDELARVVLFWIRHGVRIFRVDNPHTKSFRFWQWMMAGVRRQHPGVIFLSEAFTRPKVMRHLAKIGFSQSYSYFTWRNTTAEISEYFTELAQTDVREYMRPNLFVNTPDILPEYLQRGGRPAFEVRLVLAATLGATYGIYSGFELCENRPVARGSEEYLDSEKYQVQAVGLESAGPHHAADRTHQPAPARASRAPGRLESPIPPYRQRTDHLLQQTDGRSLGRRAGGRQSGSVPDAARLRAHRGRRVGPRSGGLQRRGSAVW